MSQRNSCGLFARRDQQHAAHDCAPLCYQSTKPHWLNSIRRHNDGQCCCQPQWLRLLLVLIPKGSVSLRPGLRAKRYPGARARQPIETLKWVSSPRAQSHTYRSSKATNGATQGGEQMHMIRDTS